MKGLCNYSLNITPACLTPPHSPPSSLLGRLMQWLIVWEVPLSSLGGWGGLSGATLGASYELPFASAVTGRLEGSAMLSSYRSDEDVSGGQSWDACVVTDDTSGCLIRRHVFLLIVNSEAKAGQLVHHCFASSSQTGNQHLFTLKGSRSLGLKFNRRK